MIEMYKPEVSEVFYTSAPMIPSSGLSECRKVAKNNSAENFDIRPGFPGTARQGRCAVKPADFILSNKPQNT
jgi:hypothetical protein